MGTEIELVGKYGCCAGAGEARELALLLFVALLLLEAPTDGIGTDEGPPPPLPAPGVLGELALALSVDAEAGGGAATGSKISERATRMTLRFWTGLSRRMSPRAPMTLFELAPVIVKLNVVPLLWALASAALTLALMTP